MSDTSIPQKECTRCHETKIVYEFHRQTKSPDGYRTICKKCRALAEGKVYIPYEPEGFKYCRHCEQMLPATYEYYQPVSNGKYGLESRCRACKNAEWVERYHADEEAARESARIRYAANPEPTLARGRRRRIEHPEYWAEWYQKNKIRLKPIRRLYYDNNRDYLYMVNTEWAKNNQDRIKAAQKRYRSTDKGHLSNRRHRATRRARIANAPGAHTSADILLQRKAQTDKKGRLHCWYCGKVIQSDDYHLEHSHPLSRGGSNGAENIVISCPTCNLSKGSKNPQEWAGRLI